MLSRMEAAARDFRTRPPTKSEPRQGELSGLGGQMTVTGVSGGTLCSPPAQVMVMAHNVSFCTRLNCTQSREMAGVFQADLSL